MAVLPQFANHSFLMISYHFGKSLSNRHYCPSFISNLSNQTFSMNCSCVKNVLLKTANSRVFFFSHRGTGMSICVHKPMRHASSLSLKLCSASLSSAEDSFISFPSTYNLPFSVKSLHLSLKDGDGSPVSERTVPYIPLFPKLVFY